MAYKDAQELAKLIRTYTPRVDTDGLWKYLQGIHLPLLFKFRAKRLEKHIEKHCYVDRRERFLFTEDFKVALEEYQKGFKIVVQDDGGVMGHGGISEVFELPEPSQGEQALQEFTQFCRQRKSKYYYFIHYRSNTE